MKRNEDDYILWIFQSTNWNLEFQGHTETKLNGKGFEELDVFRMKVVSQISKAQSFRCRPASEDFFRRWQNGSKNLTSQVQLLAGISLWMSVAWMN